jgi:Nif-specific regulatory protein
MENVLNTDFRCKKSKGQICYGRRELTLLLEIITILNDRRYEIKSALKIVVEKLADHLSSAQVMLTIVNRATNKIVIEMAHGLSDEIQKHITYRFGEGIIGKVVETGKPVVLPRVSESEGFLNKTGILNEPGGSDISFICIPVLDNKEIVGTLSINKVYNGEVAFSEDAGVLSITGAIIAQTVRFRQEHLEEVQQLREENKKLHIEIKERIRPANLIGNSGKMIDLFDMIDKVAPTNSTVLIRGESGVGKELVADAIHFGSQRAKMPFIKVNCAALPESLIESELFGHEKGSFTGASTLRIGRFEAAQGGTIFLDEIGELPPSTQVKLLRVLQQREFERLGSTQPIKADVRVICATNRNLEELIQKGDFREDLYYRINVFPVFIPPLRERINDIPGLADYFIMKFNKNNDKKIRRISSSAIDMLMVYHWPGNIRELENCIERACIMSTDNVIRANNLPPTLQTASASGTKYKGTLDTIVSKVEEQIILETLHSTKGNILKASKLLGITERMMGIRIKKYCIDPKRYKPPMQNV